jgi:YHS domain-containing protein
LANGKHVQTDCKVNMTREDGKTYCFSTDRAMDAFMKDPSGNAKKATETFGRS